jgi:hypothetical protein
MDGQGETREFAREDGAHPVRHVELFAEDLFHCVGDGSDFDVPERFDQGSVILSGCILRGLGVHPSAQESCATYRGDG